MAKSKRASGDRSARKNWPRSGSLQRWLECYLDSCEQLAKPSRSAIRAGVRLRQLAECGFETQALKRLERILALLDPTDVDSFVRLCLVGSEICLEIPNLKRADKYLAAIEARLPEARPSKRKLLTRLLQTFRILNGLAEEVSGRDARERLGKARHQYRLSVLDGDQSKALASVRRATRLIPEVDDFILERGLILSAIKAYHRLGNDDEVARYVSWIDRNHYSNNLDTGGISAMGLVAVANKRAEKLIIRRLNELKTADDPNVHFPVNEICSQLWFFIQTNESATAAKLLKRALRELPKWPGLCGGFSTSGALTMFAEVLAEIKGPEAALELLGYAVEAGTREAHKGFRQGARKAANQLIETPGIAAAIEKASAIRNAKKRREALIPLHAKSGNWAPLSALLDEGSNAEEVHQLIHSVLFELPGGARL
jgi:tetratricopeptide (TPR) repeat protein